MCRYSFIYLATYSSTRFPCVDTHIFISQPIWSKTISMWKYSYFNLATSPATRFQCVNIDIFISQPIQQQDFYVKIFICLSRNLWSNRISMCKYSYIYPATYAATRFPCLNTHILVSNPMHQHDFDV